MRLGDTYEGFDGTIYNVVKPLDVKWDQPRWWIDEAPPPKNRMLGPATPARLHTLPAYYCLPVAFALVLP